MMRISVCEEKDSAYGVKIMQVLEKTGAHTILIGERSITEKNPDVQNDILIVSCSDFSALSGMYADIFITSDDEREDRGNFAKDLKLKCSYAVMWGETASQFVGSVSSNRVITYGMSPRDTVTLSSVFDDDGVIALQREIVAMGDTHVEQCEINVHGIRYCDMARLMACAATLLVCGEKRPYRLTRLLSNGMKKLEG